MNAEAFRKLLAQWAKTDVYIGQISWEEGDALAEHLAKWYASQQSVHPTKGGLVLRACVNGECGWVGKESACLTWKHAGDERMCPHCNDNTESVSLSALRG